MIVSGRPYYLNGEEDYTRYSVQYGPSRHYTMVFHVFVFLQVCNEINARRLDNQFNIFERFFENSIFLFIIIITFVVQLSFTWIGGKFLGCNEAGLTGVQILISIGFGMLAFPFRMIACFVPDDKLLGFLKEEEDAGGDKDDEDDEEEEADKK